MGSSVSLNYKMAFYIKFCFSRNKRLPYLDNCPPKIQAHDTQNLVATSDSSSSNGTGLVEIQTSVFVYILHYFNGALRFSSSWGYWQEARIDKLLSTDLSQR